jgi:CBS domain-containing protein
MQQRMTAGELCTRVVATAVASLAVNEAARVMRENHVGDLVIVEPDERGPMPVGILTDRDIVMAVVARDVDPATVRVADMMSSDLVCVAETDSVLDALAQMRRKSVRRVPVTGPHGVLVGIVALDDVLEAVADELQSLVSVIAGEPRREKAARP